MEYTALVVRLIHPCKVIQTTCLYDENLLLNITAHISTDALMMILTISLYNYYASVGGAPEAYGSRRLCVCLSVFMSFARISLQRLKTKR